MDANLAYQISLIKQESDPFAQAKLISALHKEKDISIKYIGERIKQTSSNICNSLRLLNLPDTVIDGYYSKTVSKTHLLILSRVRAENEVIDLYEKILSQSLTVAQTEMLVREHLYGIKTEGQRITDAEKKSLTEIFKKIDERIHVEVIQTRIKAKVLLTIKGSVVQTSNILSKLASGKFVKNKE